MSIDNYLKSNCEYGDIEMNKQTVENWCDEKGIKSVRLKLIYERDNNGEIKGKKGIHPCSWNNMKIPSFNPSNKPNTFHVFDEEIYAEYLAKRSEIDDYNIIAIDTRQIKQIDFDQNIDQSTIEKLKEICPYYSSCTRRYPHFFIKNDELDKLGKVKKQFKTKNCNDDQGEILIGQWAYCKANEPICNGHKNVPNYKIGKDSDISFYTAKTKVKVNEPKKTVASHITLLEPLVKELASIIDPTLYLDSGCHDDYVKLMWSLHDYRDIAYDLTQKGNSSKKIEEFNSLFDSYDETKGIDFEYFKSAAKKSNEIEFNKIMKKHGAPPSLKSLSNEKSIAEEIYKRYGNYWVFQNKTCYRWYPERKRWFEDEYKADCGNASVSFVDGIYTGWFDQVAQDLCRKKEKEGVTEEYEKMLKDFEKKKNRSVDLSFQKNVWKILMNIICKRRDNVIWDNHPELFAFNNCVYNFETRQFSEQLKEQYLFRNVDYNWVDPPQHQIDLLKSIFDKIFYENKDSERVYMSVLRNGLTGWCPEKFVIFNSGGRSGKGMLNDFMLNLLNGKDTQYGYGKEISVDILLGNIKTDKANVDLAQLAGKRFVKIEEGCKHDKLCVATIKKLTGGGNICARTLYSTDTSHRVDGVFVFETNNMLQLDENDTSGSAAVVKRFMDVKIGSTFCDKVRPGHESKFHISQENLEKKEFFCNTKIKEPDWRIKHRCAYFKYLVDYKNEINDPEDLLCPLGRSIYVSKEVLKRTKKYLDDSDYYKDFIEEYIEVGCEEKEKINKTTLTYNSESDKDFVLISDIYKRFIESDFYKCLDKQQQRSVTRKALKKYIEEHSEYKEHYLPLFTFHYGKRQNQRNVMRPWKWKVSEEDCIVSSEDELDD